MRVLFLGLISVLLLPLVAFAESAPNTDRQGELTKLIDSSIEWANHLKTETAEGAKMDKAHFEKELQGNELVLDSLLQWSSKMLVESPHEAHEGHFTNSLAAQVEAINFFHELESAHKTDNYKKMEKAARNMVKSLKDAKHWHGLELSEIEQHPTK